jgi:hypothetical protein
MQRPPLREANYQGLTPFALFLCRIESKRKMSVRGEAVVNAIPWRE